MKHRSCLVPGAIVVVAFVFLNSLRGGEQQANPAVTLKEAMNYFAGDWRGAGLQGNFRYKGRETAEWDLHHNIMSHRVEFFGGNFVHTLLALRMRDPLKNKIMEHQFASWGIYRKGEYQIGPHGKWFHLVGACEQTGENGKKTHINIITVHDEDHYTWASVPQVGVSGAPFIENYSREGVEPRDGRANETAQYLEEVIAFTKDKENVDQNEVIDLKRALGRFYVSQSEYVKAAEVLSDARSQQMELLSAEDPPVQKTTSAIVQACRNCAYSYRMDEETSAEDVQVALKLARKAAELAPDDQRIWLQAFAHYRLGDNEAAQQAIRETVAKDGVWPAVPLLAAMVEHKAGNDELAQACYMLGTELARKYASPEPAKWMAMAKEAIGTPPAIGKMDQKERLAAYDTVLTEYAGFADAYRLRGRFYGSRGDWDKALADYRKAADLRPDVLRYREGEAAITLWHGTSEEQKAVCNKLFEEWEKSDNQTPRGKVRQPDASNGYGADVFALSNSRRRSRTVIGDRRGSPGKHAKSGVSAGGQGHGALSSKTIRRNGRHDFHGGGGQPQGHLIGTDVPSNGAQTARAQPKS